MRLVNGLLAMMLAASLAHADEPAPPPAPRAEAKAASHIPLRVVRVMPESNQALLFDRTRNTHVLVEVGQTVDGYAVDDIGDDEVTLSSGGKQVVLAAPMRGRRGDGPRQGRVRSASASDAPVDPYSDGVRVAEAPGAPVTPGSDGVRVATAAPSDPYEEPVRVVEADPGTPSTSDAPRVAPAAGGAPRVVHAPPASSDTPADPYASPADGAPRVVHAPAASDPDGAPRTVSAPPASSDVPADPYASPQPAPSTGEPAPRVVHAPPSEPAPGVVHAPAAARATPSRNPKAGKHETADPRSMAEQFAATATGTKATPTPANATAAGRSGQITFARNEVNAALSDFGRLADAIHGSFGPTGVKVDGVAEGSLFERAGIRAGDTIASVNGIVPHTLDDAANIYALASSVKTMTVLLVRDGKQTALRIAIQ